MFYPYRDECELNVGQPPSSLSKLSEPGVSEMVNNDKEIG